MAVSHTISRAYEITIVRRSLLPSLPGSAEPLHGYATVVGPIRANVTSLGGVADVANVTVDGKKATHKFALRYFPDVDFDVRDRIRTVDGRLLQILSVEDKDLANREWIILASSQGMEDEEAAT